MITGIVMPSGENLKFAYDALGRRILKSVISGEILGSITVKSTYYSYGLGNSPIIDEVIISGGEGLPEFMAEPTGPF